MGGGGGISPISIISDILFSSASGIMGGAQQRSGGAVAETTDTSAADEAEARQRADRKKAEAALLAKARQSDRAEQAGQDGVAETLGAPTVAAAQLKERLGQ
jgi:hypothetical protein